MCTVARLAQRLAASFAVLCLLGNPLLAQDRMPPIPADKLTEADRKSTRLNSSHIPLSRMPSSA